MGNEISQKIDAYAKANLQTLKQEEAKTGRKMTKFDIAQYMLQKGKLNQNEYANWMNTREGFDAQAMTKQQTQALKQGNVWGFAGYGGGEESYLDSMTSFSQKNPVEKQNAISHRQMKLNETVAERKKKAAEINNNLKNERVLNQEKTVAEQEFKAHVDSAKISEEDKDKDPIELTKEIKNIEETEKAAKAEEAARKARAQFIGDEDAVDIKRHPVKTILTSPLRAANYIIFLPIAGIVKGCQAVLDSLPEPRKVPNYKETVCNKVFTQLKNEGSEQKETYEKNIKTIENFINNFPQNKTELKKNIEKYSKYANMDEVKTMLDSNDSFTDIKIEVLKQLEKSLHSNEKFLIHKNSNKVLFEEKDLEIIKEEYGYKCKLYIDLAGCGYTAEQIHDRLPSLGDSVDDIKGIIASGSYTIIEVGD